MTTDKNITTDEIRFTNNASRSSMIGLSNSFTLLDDRYLRIPYGDHSHELGIQRLTNQAAKTMVRNFASLRGKLARRFGGLPIYIGHPDDSHFANTHKDTRAYGWIMDMAAREDALFLDVKWSEPGRELLANAHYKYFSPRWAVKKIGTENRENVFEPLVLLSAGLTNQPNLPVMPLANAELGTQNAEPGTQDAKQKLEDHIMTDWLKQTLGLSNEATEDELKKAVSTLAATVKASEDAQTTLANEKSTRENAETLGKKALAELTNEKKARETADAALANERKARIELIVSNAIADGKVLPADKDKWTEDLGKEFDSKLMELSNAKPALKVKSETDGLGGRSSAEQSKQTQILTLVNERMEKTKLDYDACFLQIKKENPALFEKKAE